MCMTWVRAFFTATTAAPAPAAAPAATAFEEAAFAPRLAVRYHRGSESCTAYCISSVGGGLGFVA